MDRHWMNVSGFISGMQMSGKPAATELRAQLARRTFLIVFGIAMAGALVNPAYAESCASLRTQLNEANAKKNAAAARAASLAAQYQANPQGRVKLSDVNAANAKRKKYEQRIVAIANKTKNCTPP